MPITAGGNTNYTRLFHFRPACLTLTLNPLLLFCRFPSDSIFLECNLERNDPQPRVNGGGLLEDAESADSGVQGLLAPPGND